MKNLIILGSGRSGTSMLAGLFAKAGYFFGGNTHPPRDSNPKGFFETKEINGINEEIIALSTPQRPPLFGNLFFRKRPTKGQRWLSKMLVDAELQATTQLKSSIQALLQNEPYCFKDPRFSYTLPVWRPYLKNNVFLCVFREPATTVFSILKECAAAPYLKDLVIDKYYALEIWSLMYTHILNRHSKEGNWLFIHYDQIFEKQILQKLSTTVEADLDSTFPDRALKRSIPDFTADSKAMRIYEKLCKRSDYDPAKQKSGHRV